MSDFNISTFSKTFFDRGSRPGDVGYNDLLRALRAADERIAALEAENDTLRSRFEIEVSQQIEQHGRTLRAELQQEKEKCERFGDYGDLQKARADSLEFKLQQATSDLQELKSLANKGGYAPIMHWFDQKQQGGDAK